jgi:CubicO group peptidase (beta-lactamase class C family)
MRLALRTQPGSVSSTLSVTFGRGILSLALLLVCVGRADNVDDYIREEMNKQHIPGLSLAVIKDGKVIKAEGYGLANVELNVPVKANTVYQLQSITKSFTATGIMLLVEEGEVELSDKITKYLDGLPATWNEISVRHLLTHTSGIKDFINEPTVDLRNEITPEAVIKSLADKPLNFQPGEKYTYSNTGYHLLGMIIHKVTGKLWGNFLRERIFEPLEMAETRVVSLSDVITNRASGYAWVDDKLQNGRFIAPTILSYAGGGLRSTVLDLVKWDAALYTEKILKRSSREQMWTAATLNDGSKTAYGYGWGIGKLQGHRRVGHNGAHATGFHTTFNRYPDDKLSVTVLANQRGANTDAIADGVAKFYLAGAEGTAARSSKDQ